MSLLDGTEPASVLASALSNMYILVTSRPIAIKLYQKHQHCGRELPVLDFVAERIRTLVSMATNSAYRVIMGEMLSTLKRPHF